MSGYKTRYLTRDEYEKWDELVSKSPASNIFDTTLWLNTLSSVLNSDISILGVFNNGNLIGGVATNVIERFGIKIAKTPHMCNFNSCHYIPRKSLHRSKQERHIYKITTLIAERLQKDFHHVVITNHPEFNDVRGFRLNGWVQNIIYSYSIHLSKMDFSLISSSKKGWVKKARKNLIKIEEINNIVTVYNIIEQTYTKQGIQCPLTLDELSGIYKKISDSIVILAAKEQEHGRYIAVYVIITDNRKSCAYSMFNGYDTGFANSGANSLLLWETIEYFKNKGFELLDTGEALMSSKASFKSEFSSDLVPYYQVSKSNLWFRFLWHFSRGKIARN